MSTPDEGALANPVLANPSLVNHGDHAAATALHDAFSAVTGEPVEFRGDWRVPVDPAAEAQVATYARDVLGFSLLVDRLGADQGPGRVPRFDVITVLYNLDTQKRLILVASVPLSRPELPTLTGVFRGAGWFEREIYDMYGVIFAGHPDPRRILMPDEFDAFPLRKEYPMEGHGAWAAPRRALGGNVDGQDGRVALPPRPGQPGPGTRDPLHPEDDVQSQGPHSASAHSASALKGLPPTGLPPTVRPRPEGAPAPRAFPNDPAPPRNGDRPAPNWPTGARTLDVDVPESGAAESMLINMGPQHPSTHGVLRLVLELDGEDIVRALPDIGFLHRAKEKVGETFSFHKFIPYTDRLDYLAPLSNNVAYALAAEKLFGVECPPRAQAIRVICHELSRISAHLLGLGAYAMDLGAMTIFLWTFREREQIYSLIERICGARFTTSYTRIGGVERDLPADFWPLLQRFVKEMPGRVDEYDAMLTRNKIWVKRTQGVGVITKEQCLQFGLTGPILRGSGIEHDLRKSKPYLGYERYDFDVPIGTEGDCYDRYMVRIEEMRQSVRILDQVLQTIPAGPVINHEGELALKTVLPDKTKVLTNMESLIHQFMVGTESSSAPAAGEVYFSVENPKGELGFYLRSDGRHEAARLRIRGPSFANLQVLEELLPGHMVADVMAILGSIDFVMGECDR